ncbi:hypothetical protein DPMN_121411 [Dreissena polymorpha]|uniref:Uncharacterized protein n=1 Tax=Dreissena polymorpha TaxID=45954 RepID=A0A9D4GM14_DREPO|nr:hypothetical protein DPMN_121411 [Dreissena polymorpha]
MCKQYTNKAPNCNQLQKFNTRTFRDWYTPCIGASDSLTDFAAGIERHFAAFPGTPSIGELALQNTPDLHVHQHIRRVHKRNAVQMEHQ